ncbi:MAG: protease pro-enzyme activation domain-containing protein [Candidatus Korobacteraceae bacterium]
MFTQGSGRGLVLVAVVSQLIVGLISVAVAATPPERITQTVNDADRTPLRGNVYPSIRSALDVGKSNTSIRIERIKLIFQRTTEQQRELDVLLAQQQDPGSPNFHKWLTPDQFADRFGLGRNDVAKVAVWLRSRGFSIAEIARSRTYIAFSGTSAQVESAFHTQIHLFLADGSWHFANVTEPSIPSAFAGVVSGLTSLHNFGPMPKLIRPRPRVTSSYTGNHFLQPGDFATIYNLTGLYNSGIDGTGQTIAVMGQTDLVTDSNGNFTDVATFRANSGLSAPNLTSMLIPNTADPGVVDGDITEANLDVEWAGGVAKNAQILFVIGNATTGGGTFDALQYAVSNNLAPVISISYGLCEQQVDSGTQQSIVNAGMEANAQGQTIVAPAGDDGAADCDYNNYPAKLGFAVDFPASMPYATSAGGSEFTGDQASNPNPNCVPTQYWGCGSGSVSDTSATALSYIPEMVWNDTFTDDILEAGGGGLSILFSQPTWQSGLSVITNGMRGVPDISFSASVDHDSYLICSQGSCSCGFRDSCTVTNSTGSFDAVGGTSASTPSFAGIVALINQKAGVSQGNVNPTLYSMATTTPSAFHDITVGNNIVPCTFQGIDCPRRLPYQFGYTAGPGYDLASGLGSVDVGALVASWTGPQIVTLSVTPPTEGTVTSNDGQINCGPVCSANYDPANNTVVTLTATPNTGWAFNGWGGVCSGVGACVVTMTQSQAVTASFMQLSYLLSVSVSGNGTVASGDGHINCGSTCTSNYLSGATVTLTAAPAQNWVFTNWSGCDTVSGNTCSVSMNSARSASATFSPLYSLSVSTSGSGTVTSSDGFINCGPNCTHNYLSGTTVTLTATPGQNWVFTSWSGCDTTSANVCSVTMSRLRQVTATFTALYSLSVSTSGSGTVTSSDGFINCGSTCSHTYLSLTAVTLTATPAQNSVLTAWTGCDAVHGNICTVSMYTTRVVSATFKATAVVTVATSGNGTVISGDGRIQCGAACFSSYPIGTTLGLTAVPDVGSQANWSGCTSVNGNVCAVVVNTPTSVSATFLRTTVTFSSLTFSPSTARHGQVAVGTLTLASPAPAGGVTIGLSSSAPMIVTVPSVVFIPGGLSSVKFAARVIGGRPTTATITATDGNTATTGILTVIP